MMRERVHLALLSALVVLTAGTVMALVCERPMDPEICKRIQVYCLQFEDVNCTASGGEILERDGICNYCRLCVRYVGAGDLCNATVVQHGSVEGGVGVFSVCRAPLVCSNRINGTCVNPEDCVYEPTE